MKIKAWMMVLAAALAVGTVFTAAQAQVEPADYCIACSVKNAITTDWFKLGADLRLRERHLSNVATLDDSNAASERHYQRYRGRFWASLAPAEWAQLNTRLVGEWFHFCKPDVLTDDSPDSDVTFDILNITSDLRSLNVPLKIVVGRQDIILGSGWLILEGTPLDGSRTIYFDAVRTTLDLSEQIGTTADFVFVRNRAEVDHYIKPFNHDNVMRRIAETDENAGIVYVSNKSVDVANFDVYGIYTNREQIGSSNTVAEFWTFGARAYGKAGVDGLTYDVEGAAQFGRRENQVGRVYVAGDDRNIDGAFGVRSKLNYAVGGTLNPQTHVGYEYRSGDKDPAKGFDVLFGRYPQWSNVYLCGYGPENLEGMQPAMSSNFHRFNVGGSVNPFTGGEVAVDYHLLFADNNNQAPGATSGSADVRGHVFTSKFVWKMLDNHVTHTIVGEAFVPGNYYSSENNDISTFCGYELNLSF